MAFLGSATRDYRFGLMREMMDREGYLCVVPRDGEAFAILNGSSRRHGGRGQDAGGADESAEGHRKSDDQLA